MRLLTVLVLAFACFGAFLSNCGRSEETFETHGNLQLENAIVTGESDMEDDFDEKEDANIADYEDDEEEGKKMMIEMIVAGDVPREDDSDEKEDSNIDENDDEGKEIKTEMVVSGDVESVIPLPGIIDEETKPTSPPFWGRRRRRVSRVRIRRLRLRFGPRFRLPRLGFCKYLRISRGFLKLICRITGLG